MKEFSGQLVAEIVKKVALDYLVFLPDNFQETSQEKYPLLLFLHGISSRGNDLELVKKYGVQDIVAQPNLPFVVICPQCPEETVWSLEIDSLNVLLDDIIDLYNIDTNRVYLTGLSMGGFGTWDFAMNNPERFAAIAPICGGTMVPEKINNLVDIPVWTFHGEDDTRVPIKGTKQLVHAIEELGGTIKHTYYPGVGHHSWDQAYNTGELYEWLLRFSKKSDT